MFTYVQMSHPPNTTSLDIFIDLVSKPGGCHVDLFPQPSSFCFIDPTDCNVLCSSILTSTLVVNKDKCVWEFQEEPTVKDESLPSVIHLLYPEIPYDSATFHSPYENSFLNVSTSNHSQETPDFSLPLHFGEETSSFKHLSHMSYVFSESTKGENPCFAYNPLHDSSNHEDANEYPEFSDHGSHDLYISSSNHDVDSIDVNMSHPLVSDDISIEVVKTLQAVEALQSRLMVMSGHHYPEVSSTSNKK